MARLELGTTGVENSVVYCATANAFEELFKPMMKFYWMILLPSGTRLVHILMSLIPSRSKGISAF